MTAQPLVARDIILRVSRDFYPATQFLSAYNTYALGWESDLLVVTRNDYVHEFEVKTSIADFKAEFTKEYKHAALLKGHAPYTSRDKHGRLEGEEGFQVLGSTVERDWNKAEPHAVRYFWFAVPESIQDKVQPLLPAHAGLIVVSHRAHIIKQAPILKNSRKINDGEKTKILKSMYCRAWNSFYTENRAKATT